jgi:hypothetical protein
MPDPPLPHPLEGIDEDKVHEWYRADRAAVLEARQAREDSLITTIIQVSSAALLLVPGVLLSTAPAMPTVSNNKALYLGILAFGVALLTALSEQYFSARAYSKQLEVIDRYYFKESEERVDRRSLVVQQCAYYGAIASFVVAILLTSAALSQVR